MYSFRKVEKMANEKGCDLIGDWKKSLMNHLYWCATSTSDGKGEMTRVVSQASRFLLFFFGKEWGEKKKKKSGDFSTSRWNAIT